MCQPPVVQEEFVSDVAALAEAVRTLSNSQKELVLLLQNSLGLGPSVIPRAIGLRFRDMDDARRNEISNQANKLTEFIANDITANRLNEAMELLLTVLERSVGPDFNVNPAVGTGAPTSRIIDKPALMIEGRSQNDIRELQWTYSEGARTPAKDIDYIRRTWSVVDNSVGHKIVKMNHKLMYDDEGYPTANVHEPTEFLDDQEREKLMCDNSHLDRSHLYFETLQILRVMTEWVHGSLEDLLETKHWWESARIFRPNQELDEVSIRSNWDVLVTRQRELARQILERVDRKTEDVKTLRDGLFNATSVREAGKSGKIGQYIFVFTVATVLYLPLSRYLACIFSTAKIRK
ncbi:hypothetical protein GQ53DRAFT_817930 [Thozetella sp. PMI_491]|nr:hypothetical protein GQ53DRAFT_817930 [Thozetella sp. PMI_491]